MFRIAYWFVQDAQTKEVVDLELATTNESSAYSQRQSSIDTLAFDRSSSLRFGIWE